MEIYISFCQNPPAKMWVLTSWKARAPVTDCHRLEKRSLQPQPFMRVPLRHVGQDDLVAGLQASDHFYGAHRTAAQLDRLAAHSLASVHDFEQTDGAVGLGLHRTSDVEHRLEALEFDDALDVPFGAGGTRYGALQRSGGPNA